MVLCRDLDIYLLQLVHVARGMDNVDG